MSLIQAPNGSISSSPDYDGALIPHIRIVNDNNQAVASIADQAFSHRADATNPLSSWSFTIRGDFEIPDVSLDFLEGKKIDPDYYKISIVLSTLALVSAVLGFFFPPLLIVAGVLLAAAVYYGVEGKLEEFEEDSARAQQKASMVETESLLPRIKEEQLSKIDAFVRDKEEKEAFSKDQLVAYNQRKNVDGQTGHFRSFIEGHTYNYRISGVPEVEGKPYHEVVLEHVVKETLGLSEGEDALTRLNSCIGGSDETLKNRALQATALLRLLGDENKILSNESVVEFCDLGDTEAVFRPTPVVCGTIELTLSSTISFKIVGEEAGLFSAHDNVMDEKSKPVAIYRTSREVEISSPDANNDVAYSIMRHFERKL